jgi:ankyrin repeat protein
MGAVERGHSEVARLLLRKGADVNAKDFRCWTGLDLAKKERRKESREKIEALLRARGATQ